ncbi:MAG: membrane protease YdiL (CAAX protease family) [Planctomycetota bacterium]|jgi:membrane protease YdiL (CAAX protease family)
MTRILLFWVLGSLAIASLLAPILYSALVTWIDVFDDPYRRVFNRVAMLCGLLLLIAMRRIMGWAQAREVWSGDGSWRRRLTLLAMGASLSLVTGAAAIPIVHATSEVSTVMLGANFLVPRIAETLLLAVLVSVLEEFFFRVIVLRGLQRQWPSAVAIVLSSLLYAFVHFLTPDRSYVYPGWSALVGFEYLGAVFERMLQPGSWTGFTGLFFVGCTLAWCMHRRRSLALCIGLHAGWVIAAKLGVWFTLPPEGANWPPGWQRFWLLEQGWTWGVILLVGVIVGWKRPRED